MTATEVRQWVSQNLLTTDDLIARVGDANWIAIRQTPFAPAPNTGSYPSANREMGRPNEYLQQYIPGTQPVAQPDSTILLHRWLALMIDGLIAFPLVFMAVLPVISLLGTPLLVAYYISRDALLGNGQSVGKKALGLKVEKDDGTPLTWIDSVKRNVVFFAYLVLIFCTIPYLGWFIAGILSIPLGILFLVETIMVISTGKRIGDRWGGTSVKRIN